MRQARAIRREVVERCQLVLRLSPRAVGPPELWRGAAGVAYALIEAGTNGYADRSLLHARRWLRHAAGRAARRAGFPQAALFLGAAGIHFASLALARAVGSPR